jgi:hypothetical protein
MKKGIVIITIGIIGCLIAVFALTQRTSGEETANAENAGEQTVLEKPDTLITINTSHEGLTVFYPKYKSIDLVCAISSPEDDSTAIFCCPAAFTGDFLNEFKHFNIAGNHVSGGELHKGYSCEKNTGAFVWYKGKWEFLLKNYATELKVAADSSGMAVGQNMIIHNHVKQPLFRSNSFQYRALCELEGKLCIIQSNESIRYSDFVDMLSQAGVKHALYLDMGGWNHSWYREYEDSALTYIHNHPHKNYTNWLTFYR